jgi:hypothetical protein
MCQSFFHLDSLSLDSLVPFLHLVDFLVDLCISLSKFIVHREFTKFCGNLFTSNFEVTT